jgi:hypothetical protein
VLDVTSDTVEGKNAAAALQSNVWKVYDAADDEAISLKSSPSSTTVESAQVSGKKRKGDAEPPKKGASTKKSK